MLREHCELDVRVPRAKAAERASSLYQLQSGFSCDESVRVHRPRHAFAARASGSPWQAGWASYCTWQEERCTGARGAAIVRFTPDRRLHRDTQRCEGRRVGLDDNHDLYDLVGFAFLALVDLAPLRRPRARHQVEAV